VKIRRGHVYVVDFNPRVRTKPGKVRPAVVVQDDAVNDAQYPSTIVVPTTTRVVDTDTPMRMRLPAGTAGLERDSDALLAQVIAVANESFRKELGILPEDVLSILDAKLRLVLGL
jgi:mRNA interferase MazF